MWGIFETCARVAPTNANALVCGETGTGKELLDVIRLGVPPLHDRPENVVHLFGHFAKSPAEHHGVERPRVGDEFLERLVAHPWPGNIR